MLCTEVRAGGHCGGWGVALNLIAQNLLTHLDFTAMNSQPGNTFPAGTLVGKIVFIIVTPGISGPAPPPPRLFFCFCSHHNNLFHNHDPELMAALVLKLERAIST